MQEYGPFLLMLGLNFDCKLLVVVLEDISRFFLAQNRTYFLTWECSSPNNIFLYFNIL